MLAMLRKRPHPRHPGEVRDPRQTAAIALDAKPTQVIKSMRINNIRLDLGYLKRCFRHHLSWVPAYAGMTGFGVSVDMSEAHPGGRKRERTPRWLSWMVASATLTEVFAHPRHGRRGDHPRQPASEFYCWIGKFPTAAKAATEAQKGPHTHLRRLAVLTLLGCLTAGQGGVCAERPKAAMPDGYQMTLLIYSAISALDQANATGNYSVLRDLAAPDFKRLNTPKQLSEVFAKYRERGVVLGPVMLYQPRLTETPAIEKPGLLRLKGFFPTKPLRIGFDLTFADVRGRWKMIALGISPSDG